MKRKKQKKSYDRKIEPNRNKKNKRQKKNKTTIIKKIKKKTEEYDVWIT